MPRQPSSATKRRLMRKSRTDATHLPGFRTSRKRRSSDRFLQFLGGAEGDLLARLDLDLLARRRVAAHAGGALANHENAKTVEADTRAFLQVLGDRGDRVVEERMRGLVRHLVLFSQL